MSRPSITMNDLLDFIEGLDEDAQAVITSHLDEQVHELKGAEAAAINNAGCLEQLEYILGDVNPSEEAIKDMLETMKKIVVDH